MDWHMRLIPLMLRGYKRIQARDGAPLTAEEATAQAARILTGVRAP
jgi:hypothetical protein